VYVTLKSINKFKTPRKNVNYKRKQNEELISKYQQGPPYKVKNVYHERNSAMMIQVKVTLQTRSQTKLSGGAK